MKYSRILISRVLWAVLIGTLASCDQPTASRPPVIEVVVDTAKLESYKPKRSFVGRLEAEQDINIQAKVSGYLVAKKFRPGDIVQAGDLLFEIEKDRFDAEHAQALADVSRAHANVTVAQQNHNRGKRLLSTGAISRAQWDDLTARLLEGEASLKSSEAALKRTSINLNNTSIVAPITGRIGRSDQTVGDLVGPESGALTTLVSVDRMQATFKVSERIMLEPVTNQDDASQFDVYVQLSNNEVYPHTGHIDYVANRIDEKTGTIEVRATIPNPDGMLRPGQYVRVKVQSAGEIDVLMVPQAAVQADQAGPFVLVVNNSNQVTREEVLLGDRIMSQVIVQGGLEAGERVIVKGLQKVRPGQTVRVQHASSFNQE